MLTNSARDLYEAPSLLLLPVQSRILRRGDAQQLFSLKRSSSNLLVQLVLRSVSCAQSSLLFLRRRAALRLLPTLPPTLTLTTQSNRWRPNGRPKRQIICLPKRLLLPLTPPLFLPGKLSPIRCTPAISLHTISGSTTSRPSATDLILISTNSGIRILFTQSLKRRLSLQTIARGLISGSIESSVQLEVFKRALEVTTHTWNVNVTPTWTLSSRTHHDLTLPTFEHHLSNPSAVGSRAPAHLSREDWSHRRHRLHVMKTDSPVDRVAPLRLVLMCRPPSLRCTTRSHRIL